MGLCGSQHPCLGHSPCQGYHAHSVSREEHFVHVKNEEASSISGSTMAPSDCSPNSLDTNRTMTLSSVSETNTKSIENSLSDQRQACGQDYSPPTSVVSLDPPEIGTLPQRFAESPGAEFDSVVGMDSNAQQADASYPATVAAEAVAHAERSMLECRVLEAERILASALQLLHGKQAETGLTAELAAAEQKIRQSAVYTAVVERLTQYVEAGQILSSTTMKLCWEQEGSSLWVHAPAGASWFEFKIATDIDAPLHCCLAYANEVDMIPKYEPMLVGAPQYLGPVLPLLAVTRSLIGLLVFRIELLFEVFRVANEDFGFLAERIRADFPHEDRPIPAKHWRYKRISINTSNLWIPHGGGKSGTTCIQATKVDLGFRVPESALSYFCKHLAGSMVGNMRKNSCRAVEPDSPWQERMQLDKYGLYKECKKAEAAAEKRKTISVLSLPSCEIMNRTGPTLVK